MTGADDVVEAALATRPWPVRPGDRNQGDHRARVFVVTEPNGTEAVVRWRVVRDEHEPPPSWRWKCTTCGPQPTRTTCLHTWSVAVHLAEHLLGLVPLNTQEHDSHSERTHA